MKKIWTGTILQRIFQLMPNTIVNEKKVGYYNHEWSYKPPHFTNDEWMHALKLIMKKLKKENLFEHIPKKDTSIFFVANHCINPATNDGFRRSRAKFRMYAIAAGFMEHRDVVYLENKAHEIKRKKGVDPND